MGGGVDFYRYKIKLECPTRLVQKNNFAFFVLYNEGIFLVMHYSLAYRRFNYTIFEWRNASNINRIFMWEKLFDFLNY